LLKQDLQATSGRSGANLLKQDLQATSGRSGANLLKQDSQATSGRSGANLLKQNSQATSGRIVANLLKQDSLATREREILNSPTPKWASGSTTQRSPLALASDAYQAFETANWEASALANFVEFQVDVGEGDVDDFAVLFYSLPEDEQKTWAKGIPAQYKTASPKTPIDPECHEALLALQRFADSPTSKFLDLVAFYVGLLVKRQPDDPNLRDLLRNIHWTGTQPGAPFDKESRTILRHWLSKVKPRK
jgi:hypothetical protein